MSIAARIGFQRRWGVLAVALALSAAGCGSGSKATSSSSSSSVATTASGASTLSIGVSEAGGSAKFTGPSSLSGGLTTVRLQNSGKAPHSAQLIRIVGSHTISDALAAILSESGKTPSWLRAEGGVGLVAPGASRTATMLLPPGTYAAVDVEGAKEGSGQPAILPLTVTSGRYGRLPATPIQIVAANPSKDHYQWEIGGTLTTGANNITFISKGKTALHEITAVRITGDEPIPTLVKALESKGPPPSYVDHKTEQRTAVLDGGKSLTTQLTFSEPGKYVFFCRLTDRAGGKPHFAEGLITTETIAAGQPQSVPLNGK